MAAAVAETERCRNETGVAVGVSAGADTGVKRCDAGCSVLRRQLSYGHKSNVRSADNTQRVSRSSHYVVCPLTDCSSSSSSSSSVSTPRLHSAHTTSAIYHSPTSFVLASPDAVNLAICTFHCNTTFLLITAKHMTHVQDH